MSYSPQAGSLAHRLCVYLQARPDARLTPTEIAEQFGCKARDLTTLLFSAVTAKLIKSEKVDFGDIETRIFSAGPNLAGLALASVKAAQAPAPAPTPAPAQTSAQPASAFVPTGYVPRAPSPAPAAPDPTPSVAAPAPAPVAAASKSIKSGPGSLPELTMSMVKVHTSLPKPSRIQAVSLRATLLQGLKVGNAIEFPIAYKGTLCNAAQKLTKATGRKFSTRNLDTDTAAIWRDK
jgi:hypothetical protein